MSALAFDGAATGRGAILTADALAFAARVREALNAQVKDKSYRATPIGGEVGRFLRKLRWDNAAENTLLSYESTLSKLAYDFAHKETAELTLEDIRDFLDERWGESKVTTRRQRLAAVKSFFEFLADERGLELNPTTKIKAPKQKSVERQAYSQDIIERLRDAQGSFRDQIAIQLLGRLALRRNELRLIQIHDFDLARGTVRIHGKGDKIVSLPLFDALISDLEVYIVGRGGDEYLLYPRSDVSRPMTAMAIHNWFKRCLERAGLPTTMQMHELRHSAADNLWRETGNLMLAKQLLRHESVGTTETYLHPTYDDLRNALERLYEP